MFCRPEIRRPKAETRKQAEIRIPSIGLIRLAAAPPGWLSIRTSVCGFLSAFGLRVSGLEWPGPTLEQPWGEGERGLRRCHSAKGSEPDTLQTRFQFHPQSNPKAETRIALGLGFRSSDFGTRPSFGPRTSAFGLQMLPPLPDQVPIPGMSALQLPRVVILGKSKMRTVPASHLPPTAPRRGGGPRRPSSLAHWPRRPHRPSGTPHRGPPRAADARPARR